MTWNKIIGQENIKKILQHSILENKIAHAYCFWGDEGVGKDGIAIEFAKTTNCLNPTISGSSIEPCEVCSSCKMFSNFNHPNFQFVFSLPTSKASDTNETKLDDSTIDDIRDQLNHKSKDYYHKLSISGGNQIKISVVREVKRNLSLSANTIGRRCIVIVRADELTIESANAFLKTLEEPHDNTTIILTTTKKNSILPTILSRCQVIHFPPLTDFELETALQTRNGITGSTASIISRFAQGSYTKALEFQNEEMLQNRQKVIDVLRLSLRKKNYRIDLSKEIDEIVKSKDKRTIENFLLLLEIWFRDIVTYCGTNTTESIINIDQKDTIIKFGDNFGGDKMYQCIGYIDTALTQVKRNVPLQMILVSLFLKIRNLILS